MDDALKIVVEMNERVWDRLTNALEDLGEEEIHWRPLPESNSIDVIMRHLRLEAQWHLDSLEHGTPMPLIEGPPSRETMNSLSADYHENFKKLEELFTRFVKILRTMTLETLHQRTLVAYGDALKKEQRKYLLGHQQATHLALHLGQIRTLRNLYCRMRGKPSRFFPQNPTYPK